MAFVVPLRPIVTFASISLLALSLANTAHAGFEWTAAPKASAAMPASKAKPKFAPSKKPEYTPPTARAFYQRGKFQYTEGWGTLMPHAANPHAKTTNSSKGIKILKPGDGTDNGAKIKVLTPIEKQSKKTSAPIPLTHHSKHQKEEQNKKISFSKLEKTAKTTSKISQPSIIDDGKYTKAVGFGADMPLAFALQQIVPKGYTYAFGKGVNMGAPVSWNGGKAWPSVIQDMIAPLHLHVSINNNKAFISKSGAPLGISKIQNRPPMQKNKVATRTPTPVTKSSVPVEIHNMQPVTVALAPIKKQAKQTVPPAGSAQFWQAHRGQNLRDALIQWSPQANIELSWHATEDYRINDNVLIKDDFSSAIIELFTKHLSASRAPEISFAEPSKSNKTARLIVKDRKS